MLLHLLILAAVAIAQTVTEPTMATIPLPTAISVISVAVLPQAPDGTATTIAPGSFPTALPTGLLPPTVDIYVPAPTAKPANPEGSHGAVITAIVFGVLCAIQSVIIVRLPTSSNV